MPPPLLDQLPSYELYSYNGLQIFSDDTYFEPIGNEFILTVPEGHKFAKLKPEEYAKNGLHAVVVLAKEVFFLQKKGREDFFKQVVAMELLRAKADFLLLHLSRKVKQLKTGVGEFQDQVKSLKRKETCRFQLQFQRKAFQQVKELNK